MDYTIEQLLQLLTEGSQHDRDYYLEQLYMKVLDQFAEDAKEDAESNLMKHARTELALIGEEDYIVKGYLDMIRIFAKMGHSGGSAPFFIATLVELLNFRNLKPLTNNPDEWQQISEDMLWPSSDTVWQNRRNSEAFSNDGGKTYYLLSEGGNGRYREPLHASADWESGD